ncbi:hypothetical protein B0H63DRAFT_488521 [Podospora didyma]|uniref:Uncharacterized protein n=1 Tax=Podospora didyma TaxID=330526 RepID=A0AAE0N343_9PEZI|nr:hypothetical protein B0H63DRAFT_488521 [Podospora didyma]
MMPTRSLGGVARNAPRVAARTCARRVPRQQRRFQSTTSSPSQQAAGSGTSHFASGLAGGVAGASILYGVYLMTPSGRMSSTINKAAKDANTKYQQVASTLKDKTPSTDEAVNKIKEFCYSYVVFIPGGRQYVDAVFKDFESVRETHGDEVDKLVSEAYAKFQDIAKAGLSMEALHKTYDALTDLGQKVANLTGSAADQILDNHPQLKDKVGEPISQLKKMGEQYGPEAKKMADETWDQVKDILKSGFSAETATKVQKLVEEKTQKLREMGDKVWEKGLEQAKPYLEKNPKIKELVTENQDLLKQGNASALFKQVKSAAESGDASKLEDYVKKAVEKAKSATGSDSESSSGVASAVGSAASFSSLSKFLGGGKIQENVELLSEVVKKHSQEGEKLLEETKEELKKVLEEKAKKAQKIVEKAKKDTK